MRRCVVAAGVLLLAASPVRGQQRANPPDGGSVRYAPREQYGPGAQSTKNIRAAFHVQFDGATDVRIDQELSRPFVFQAHGRPAGLNVVSIKDPSRPALIYTWNIEEPDLHTGNASGIMLAKHRGRYFGILSTQFGQQGPDAEVVAIVFDVTGLPDTSKVKEVARIRNPTNKGGSHEAYTYKHSDGRALFFTTVSGAPFSDVYDVEKVVAGGAADNGRIARVPVPEGVVVANDNRMGIYHDMYAGYDPATHQDKFYGAGWQNFPNSWNPKGYYVVYDITKPEEPKLITTITGLPGVSYAHTFIASPDGRYAVGETERQYDPLYLFDLKPGLDGTVKTISRPVSAWTPNWKNLVHQFEMRWPYVFAAGYADGLHIFNMMDPSNPYTVAYYDTYDGPIPVPPPSVSNWSDPEAIMIGAFGVDIRNADGLIVMSDGKTGTWGFKLDGFDGWNGHQWGLPNVSSAQDWDNGPEGAAPKPTKVS